MSWWTVAWLLWLAFFVLVEGRALASRTPNSTFSEHVWAWFRVRDRRPTVLVVAARVVLGVFLLWLLLHLSFGWFTPTDPLPW